MPPVMVPCTFPRILTDRRQYYFNFKKLEEFNLHKRAGSFAAGFSGPRPTGDSGSLNSGLAALTTPFKLNLARAPHEEQLRSYAMHSVLIEPLASMAAVEDFLWPRVQRSAEDAAKEAAALAKATAAATRAEVGASAPVQFLQRFLSSFWPTGREGVG